MTGWMQKAVMWQLLEHGVLTNRQIYGLVDNTPPMITTTLSCLLKSGLIDSLGKEHGAPGVNRRVYGLTRKGAALAVELQASDVYGLREAHDPLFKPVD